MKLGSIPACAGEPCGAAWSGWSWRVYPRVCGGTRCPWGRTTSWSGLSPRVRGNLAVRDEQAVPKGSIPACAGEPQPPRWSPPFRGVYPRVCGGTRAANCDTESRRGLSPRVRGNRGVDGAQRRGVGSIPACAGEPLERRGLEATSRVYPRVCGGTQLQHLLVAHVPGLSPRVRGNPAAAPPGGSCPGSIPACAGEPSTAQGPSGMSRVYPRVCGGTPPIIISAHRRRGLSPRVRGNPRTARPRRRGDGSIPACAGEPYIASVGEDAAKVYPRVCGGTACPFTPAVLDAGLSPRVRGNPTATDATALGSGSIPACAGEPASRPPAACPARVYPRVCGGTSVAARVLRTE